MRIFDKRPLSLILCILLAAFVFFANTSKDYVLFAAAFSILLFILTFVFPRIFKGKLYAIRIAALLLTPTVFLSVIYFNYYFRADIRFADEETTVTGYVYEIDKDYSSSTDYAVIKTESVNDEPFSKYTLIAYFTKEESQQMTSGAEVTLKGNLKGFASTASSSYGKGYSAIITNISELSVTGYRELQLSNILSEYRSSLSRYVVLKTEDTYSGGLFSALLLGEQNYLEPGLKTEFKMIGVSHILALSGMHLAIICIGFASLLGVLGINKKLRTVILIIFTLSYMALTGFSSSVTRSGIMLIAASVLYLLSRTHDSVTSLFLAVTIICIIEPYAIFDLALWLSAFATLGVLAAYDSFNQYEGKMSIIIRFFRFILMSLVASLFAISATILLSDIYFGRISIIAPITALVFGVLCEIYMYLGFAALLISIFVSGLKILSPLYAVISNAAGFLSELDNVYTYTAFTPVKILILALTLALILFLILNVRKKSVAAFILCGLLVSIYTTSYFMSKNAVCNDDFIYHSDKGADTFICKSNGKICVVDSKIYDKNQAFKTGDFLESLKVCKIDTYIMPIYYFSMPDMISTLVDSVKIETIVIPNPLNQTEEQILESIKVVCDEYKVKLKTIDNDTSITVGKFSFFPIFKSPYGDKTQVYVYTMLLNDKFCTYVSSGILDTGYKHHAEKALLGTDTLILGQHGKKYSDTFIFRYEIANLKTLILNSDNIGLNDNSDEFYNTQGTCISYNVSNLYIFGE